MLIHNPIITGSLTVSGSISATEGIQISGSIENATFAVTASYVNLENVEGSASLATRLSTNETNISNLQTDSGSFSTRVSTNETDISNLQTDSGSFSTRVNDLEVFSGSEYAPTSASINDRLLNLEDFSGSLDNNFVTEIELASATSSLSSSLAVDISFNSASISALVVDSASFSTRISTNETNISNLQTDSGSFSTRISTNETDISNLQTDSGSFSTRVSTNETDISNLQTDSGSFSTRVSTNETDISNLQTDSGSFSTRVSTNETDISNLQTDSGSFSTRVSTNETDISNLQTDSGSFSTRIVNNSASIAVINNNTSSYARKDQNNTFSGLQTFTSGSFSNLVATSASFGFLTSVTGSVKIIGDAFIILNNDTPAERYAGIIVQDSGSNTTASFYFDGQTNDWGYEYNNEGSVDYGVVIFGPEYNTKGSPTYLTANAIPKAEGTHHLNDSNISDDGSIVKIESDTQITGSLTISAGTTGSFTGSFTGDGSNLTGLPPGYSVTNSSNNRIVTSVDSTTGNAEANLTFDGTTLNITGRAVASAGFTGSFTGSFIGDGSSLTGLPPGYSVTNSSNNRIITSVDSTTGNAESNLTFDGTKLNITGNVTASGGFSGNLTGTATSASYAATAPYSGLQGSVPTWNQNTTGNAATATKLQTARTIGGVSFDGSANINLPGVNTTGNQNTTGNAATATTAGSATTATNANNINISAVTSTDTSTSVVLVGAQSTGNQSPFIDSGLTYNASTNALTATTFVGALSGNATTATSATSATSATNATNSCNFNVVADNSTNATHYLIFTGGATGNQTPNSDTALTYNPSTNLLSAGCFVETSALRCKDNIHPINSPLEKVKQLKPVTFDWKHSGKNDIGFIAEEVEEILPNLIHYNEEGVVEGMNYSKITSLLVASIQEQQKQIDLILKELETLKNK